MFSSVGPVTLPSARNGRHGPAKNYGVQIPRGFSVQVFKGPTLSSFPYTATAKFDIGHRSTTNSDYSRQKQNWYSSKLVTNENSFPAPREAYESNHPRTSSSFSIYPSASKDTYIYERSLSSKSDIYSNSEYGSASTITLTSSSLFSPALSTDSTTTLKSPVPVERVLDTSRSAHSSTSTSSSRHPLPIHIPPLCQAQSSIRGILLNHTPQENSSPHSNNSFVPRAPSSRTSDLPDSDDHTRFLAEAAAPQERGSTPIQISSSSSGGPNASGSTSYNTSSSRGFAERQRFTHSIIADSDNGEDVSRQARINTELNSVSTTSYQTGTGTFDLQDFRSVPHVPVQDRRSISLIPAEPTDAGSQQVYSDSPVRSSHEQQWSRRDSTHRELPSFYGATPPTSGSAEHQPHPNASYYPTSMDSDGRLTSQSEHFGPLFARRGTTSTTGDELSSVSLLRAPSDQQVFLKNTQRRNETGVQGSSSFDTASRPTTNNTEYDSTTVPSSSSSPGEGSDHRQNRRIPSPHLVPVERNMHDSYYSSLPRHQADGSRRDTYSTSREAVHSEEFSQTRRGAESTQPSTFDGSRSTGVKQQPHCVWERDERFHASPVTRSSPEHRDSLHTRNEPSTAEAAMKNTGYCPAPGSLPSHRLADSRQESRTAPVSSAQPHSLHATAQFEANSTRMSNSLDHQSASQSATIAQDLFQTVPSERERESYDNGHVHHNSRVLPRSVSPERALDMLPTEMATPNVHHLSASLPPAPEPQRGYHSDHSIPVAPGRPSPMEGSSNPLSNQTFRDPDHNRLANVPLPALSIVESQRNSPDTYGPNDVPTTYQRSSAPVDRIQNCPPLRQVTPIQDPPDGRQRRHPRIPPPEPHRRHSDGDRPTNSAALSQRSVTPPERPSNSSLNQSASNRPVQSHSTNLEPLRRHSDGDQVITPRPTTPRRTTTVTANKRTVRWNENLVCPPPIFPSQRRKGWFNRRGDQLWTNDGAYKPPESGQQFPADLNGYPEYGKGWMNELGVLIDMKHRLIPKPPLRSAMKRL